MSTPVTAFVLIGPPGCGKTTDSKRLNGIYVSSDAIRGELTGDEGSQTCNPWPEFNRRLAEGLAAGVNVVADATSAYVADRRRLAQHCHNGGAERVFGIWLRTPLSVCLRRNSLRDRRRRVPDAVVARMYESLKRNPPRIDDGFDVVEHRYQWVS